VSRCVVRDRLFSFTSIVSLLFPVLLREHGGFLTTESNGHESNFTNGVLIKSINSLKDFIEKTVLNENNYCFPEDFYEKRIQTAHTQLYMTL
jgi:hypothetical protein